MKFNDLLTRIRGAQVTWRLSGLNFDPAHIVLDIHPRDWEDVVITSPYPMDLCHDVPTMRKIWGFAINETTLVECGHPRLRSTWEVVL